jgi:hypothetical protein
MKLALLLVLALLAGACGNDPDGAEATTSQTTPPTTTPAPSSTSTTVATTTSAPTTTTKAPVEVDLLDPVAGTLAGVQVGQGPVEPIIEGLTAAYGPPEEDRGWAPDICIGGGTTRPVLWSGLSVYLEESDTGQRLMGYNLDQAGASMVAEPIELPDGTELGMPYSAAAALFPDGAYTHDSLELDGVILQETPTLIVIGQHTDDGSGPVTEVWVGAIPTCH